MADEKPQPAKDATKEVAEKPTVGDAGARTAATESQVGVAGAAQTREQSLTTFTDNLKSLGAKFANGTATIDVTNPFAALRPDGSIALSAPPAGDRPGARLADAPAKIEPTAPTTDSKGLIRTDGKIDMPAKKPDGMSDGDFEAMRKQVEALNKHLTDPKAQLTDQQRQDIERSAEQMISNRNPDGSERKPPLDPREATKVLEQANRMFDKQDVITGNGFSVQDRNQAVGAMVHDVANPNHANQGLNNTCNVSAAAKAEMMTHPGDQAKRYVDMFANENNKDSKGMYVEMPDGKGGTQKTYYDRASITPDEESKFAASHVGGGARDAYMQGLNHLYVNAVTQQRGEYYTDGRAEFKGDTGERLHKGGFNGEVRRNKDGSIDDSPGFVAEDVQKLMTQINAGTMAADYQRFGVTNGSGVRNVTGGDPASLDAAWNANGGKPMVIAVDTNAAMFRSATDVGGKSEGGGHVVTLADRRVGADGKVEYLLQNSWGDKFNGWVSADAIASAMNPRNGDRSGAVPTAGGDGSTPADGGGNWGQQKYVRPSGGNDQQSGDGSSYGQPDRPERDPRGGIKTDQDRTSEMDYRSQLERERAAALIQKAQQEQEDAARKASKDAADKAEAARVKAEQDAKRLKEEEEARRKKEHQRGDGRDNPSEQN